MNVCRRGCRDRAGTNSSIAELTDPRVGPAAVSEAACFAGFSPRGYVQLDAAGDSGAAGGTTLAAIEHAKEFLRHQLAERLQLYRTPDLQFEPALPAALSAKAPQILKRIRRGQQKHGFLRTFVLIWGNACGSHE